jgi:hypothetical protein
MMLTFFSYISIDNFVSMNATNAGLMDSSKNMTTSDSSGTCGEKRSIGASAASERDSATGQSSTSEPAKRTGLNTEWLIASC